MSPAVRTSASVSAVLRKAGIPVGYRYTQTGYVDRDRQRVTAPGCEVTRNRRSRYSGQEDRGHVAVFLIDPSRNDLTPDPAFAQQALDALLAAGMTATLRGGSIEVADSEDAPDLDALRQDVKVRQEEARIAEQIARAARTAHTDALARLMAAEHPERQCGKRTIGGPCSLAAGHEPRVCAGPGIGPFGPRL